MFVTPKGRYWRTFKKRYSSDTDTWRFSSRVARMVYVKFGRNYIAVISNLQGKHSVELI